MWLDTKVEVELNDIIDNLRVSDLTEILKSFDADDIADAITDLSDDATIDAIIKRLKEWNNE